jgi:hypothetical protein
MKWLNYFIMFLVISYFLALITAKIYSPFWFHQPVYHVYDVYPRIRWSREPYIKRKRAPKCGIFCKPNSIETTNEPKLDTFTNLLQGHYLDNTTHLYYQTVETIQKIIHTGSYISGYYEERLQEPIFNKIVDKDVVYGMITSRPTNLFFLKFSSKNFQIHFMDFISVHEKYKKENISRNLIQTHIYNHSVLDPQFSGVYVFKKEVELCRGIVPLIESKSYTFVLKKTPIKSLPYNYSTKCLNKTHLDLWRAIYVQMTNQYEICVLPEIPVTIEWLKNERYIIYISVYREEGVENIHGVYIFEDTCVSWEQDLEKPRMLRLAASMVFGVHMHDPHGLYYFRGFLHSLKSLILDRKDFGILEIPNISDNDIILERWREKYTMRNETAFAYYFYNLVYPNMPIYPNNVIIL